MRNRFIIKLTVDSNNVSTLFPFKFPLKNKLLIDKLLLLVLKNRFAPVITWGFDFDITVSDRNSWLLRFPSVLRTFKKVLIEKSHVSIEIIVLIIKLKNCLIEKLLDSEIDYVIVYL